MTNDLSIVWLRRDLRLTDNPALDAAISASKQVVILYVYDDHGPFAHGGAGQWWLHHSLARLSADIEKRGSKLILRAGNGGEELMKLVEETGARSVYWNRRYDKQGIEEDKKTKSALMESDVKANSFNGALLCEPWSLKTKTGGFYKVFTPFWRALQEAGPERPAPSKAPKKLMPPKRFPESLSVESFDLLPTRPNWAEAFDDEWTPGEKGAAKALETFLENAVGDYGEDRNRPDIEGTSRLSPHLAFGEISPLQIWVRTKDALEKNGNKGENGVHVFLSEIAWREFAYVLLYHYPDIQTDPIKPAYSKFNWQNDRQALRRWQRGQTGYPIVDAGMRQLWQTGWMHNRVRMIVASFLIKNMLTPWQEGERWFWDTLVDADPASNTASWQWVAGSGADAAPYFRIFNPVTQAQKFDPDGKYVCKYVPEIAEIPRKYIHCPYDAPEAVLKAANVRLGETYPLPMLDLSTTRKRALDAYERVKEAS
ncbi:MAG: deoxyribodipyrimidine photo-lyase [Pseudomonadota bacterium]